MAKTAKSSQPGKEVVYLDVDDDITTIIDKVEVAKNKLVVVVLPKRFATLQSIVNMRLLKRSADRADKKIVLVTSEAALLPLAGAAGIHVAKNLQSQPEIPPSPVDLPVEKPAISADPDAPLSPDDAKLDYHRSIGELAAAHTVDEPETIPLEDGGAKDKPAVAAKPPKHKKTKVPDFDRFRLLLLLGAVGLIALIVFLIFALFILPKATITLKTEAQPISTSFELTTSDKATELDMKKRVIPVTLKTSDLTREENVKATGQQNNGKKASGSVKMTTQRCAPNIGTPPDVPAGTGLSTGGNHYVTQSNAKFEYDSASGSCVNYDTNNVSIIAQAGGTKYNVSNASFSISGRSDVNATGSASGGTDDIVTILSQSDVNAVTNKINDQVKGEFVNNLRKELDTGGLYGIEASLKEEKPSVSASPEVGQPASTARVTVKITYSLLTVKKEHLSKAITEELNKQIDKNRQKIGTSDLLKDLEITIDSQSSPTVATLAISKDTTAVPVIDEADIKAQIGGKKSGEIKGLLGSYPGIKEVEVRMSPFWVSKAPKKASKITIVQEQIKTEADGSEGNPRP